MAKKIDSFVVGKKNRRLTAFETRPSPLDDARTDERTMNDANAPEGDAPETPREERPLRHQVRHTMQVVGMMHQSDWKRNKTLWNAEGRELRFSPRPWSNCIQSDPNAIAVYSEPAQDVQIGWVPSDIAAKVTPMIHAGKLEIKSPGVIVGMTRNEKCLFVDVEFEFNLEKMSEAQVERFMHDLSKRVMYNR